MSDTPEQKRDRASVDLADAVDGFALQNTTPPVSAPSAPAPKSRRKQPPKLGSDEPPQVLSYRHADRRVNNPEVGIGMVTPATDPDAGRTRWAYDPHLDPELRFDPSRAQIEALIDAALESGDPERMCEALEELKRLQSPYLAWAGKAERTSFELDLVSLHVRQLPRPEGRSL